MTQNYSALWWAMLVILTLMLAFTIYKMVFLGQSCHLNFSVIAALSLIILKETPLFIKHKYLSIIPAAIAVILFVWEIVLALKK